MKFFNAIYEYADMIKLGHTLFALPFALAGASLAYINGCQITPPLLLWIILAFTGARSAAMGFNRIADKIFDKENPRTASRALPAGRISAPAAFLFVALSLLLFFASAFMINRLCFILSFPALILLFGYSYCKRFTPYSHFVLGAALALAPIGAYLAVSGVFDFGILALGAALIFHISAFDIFYALQDMDFDKNNFLFSIPSKFGESLSLKICFILFILAAAMLFLTGFLFGLNFIYFAIICMVSLVYFSGFFVFKKAGLAKINAVFFNMNVSSSLLIFLAALSQIFFP